MVIELFVTARHPVQQFITCHNETESKSHHLTKLNCIPFSTKLSSHEDNTM